MKGVFGDCISGSFIRGVDQERQRGRFRLFGLRVSLDSPLQSPRRHGSRLEGGERGNQDLIVPRRGQAPGGGDQVQGQACGRTVVIPERLRLPGIGVGGPQADGEASLARGRAFQRFSGILRRRPFRLSRLGRHGHLSLYAYFTAFGISPSKNNCNLRGEVIA